MPAYIIARIHIIDPVRYADYMKAVPEIIARHGGRYIARGGDKVTLEGPPETSRIVLLEFPSLQLAQAFYHSVEYQTAKSLRDGAATAQFIAVNGILES